jgi:hypothetical protein
MKLSVQDFRQALDIIGDAGGAEAAIVAQFALDLAVTARFDATSKPIEPREARRLLRLRIARHRATRHASSSTVH